MEEESSPHHIRFKDFKEEDDYSRLIEYFLIIYKIIYKFISMSEIVLAYYQNQ